jgi:hypothetical protein
MPAARTVQVLRMREEGIRPGAIAATLGVRLSSVLGAFERVDEDAFVGR